MKTKYYFAEHFSERFGNIAFSITSNSLKEARKWAKRYANEHYGLPLTSSLKVTQPK